MLIKPSVSSCPTIPFPMKVHLYKVSISQLGSDFVCAQKYHVKYYKKQISNFQFSIYSSAFQISVFWVDREAGCVLFRWILYTLNISWCHPFLSPYLLLILEPILLYLYFNSVPSDSWQFQAPNIRASFSNSILNSHFSLEPAMPCLFSGPLPAQVPRFGSQTVIHFFLYY